MMRELKHGHGSTVHEKAEDEVHSTIRWVKYKQYQVFYFQSSIDRSQADIASIT